MPDKEHPARTAGRYVRAARIAISNERERRAADAAQRAAQAPQAEQQPAAEAAAPPRAAAPTPARTRAARTPAPAPPPKPFLDNLLYYIFLISLVAVGLAGLQVQMLTSGSPRVGIRLGLGIALILVAVPLLSNWQRSKERLTARFFKKIWGVDAPVSRSGRVMRKIGNDVMTLIGIIWLALGTFEVLRAFVEP